MQISNVTHKQLLQVDSEGAVQVCAVLRATRQAQLPGSFCSHDLLFVHFHVHR